MPERDGPRILIALGGASTVWRDFVAACEIIGDRPHGVGAVNEAGRDYDGHLTIWASLHPEKLGDWQAGRKGNQDYIAVAHKEAKGARVDRAVPELWSGSSGLYLCQVAVITYGYDRILCCGIPMTESPHYFSEGDWDSARQYQKGWAEAVQQPELAGKIRSLSGWTKKLLGRPDEAWLAGGA